MITTPVGKPAYFLISISEIEAMLEYAKKGPDQYRNIVVIHEPNGILGSIYVCNRNQWSKWCHDQPDYNDWSLKTDVPGGKVPDFATDITDWDLA